MVRDIKLIDADIEACRADYKEVLKFMGDKPFMKSKIENIVKALNEKCQYYEALFKSNQDELRQINEHITHIEDVLSVEPLTKSDILKQGFVALYQMQNDR